MSRLNIALRHFRNTYNRLRLKNKDFSLFSSNCNGGCICHDLGLAFRSPYRGKKYFDSFDYVNWFNGGV